MTEEIPLIYTSKGNIPISNLEHSVRWDIQEGRYIKFTEIHTLNGEVVRESPHIFSYVPLDIVSEQGEI